MAARAAPLGRDQAVARAADNFTRRKQAGRRQKEAIPDRMGMHLSGIAHTRCGGGEFPGGNESTTPTL